MRDQNCFSHKHERSKIHFPHCHSKYNCYLSENGTGYNSTITQINGT